MMRTCARRAGAARSRPEQVPRFGRLLTWVGWPGVQPGWSRGTISMCRPPESLRFRALIMLAKPGSGFTSKTTSPSGRNLTGVSMTTPWKAAHGLSICSRSACCTPSRGLRSQARLWTVCAFPMANALLGALGRPRPHPGNAVARKSTRTNPRSERGPTDQSFADQYWSDVSRSARPGPWTTCPRTHPAGFRRTSTTPLRLSRTSSWERAVAWASVPE
jgi:hypothetical protein